MYRKKSAVGQFIFIIVMLLAGVYCLAHATGCQIVAATGETLTSWAEGDARATVKNQDAKKEKALRDGM